MHRNLVTWLGISGTVALSTAGAAVGGTLQPQDLASLNLLGAPGLIDMPSGEPQRDAELSSTFSGFGGNLRGTLTFQFSSRISASFRYIGIQDWNRDGFSTYYDRSFDVRFLLLEEQGIWPSLSVGLQDFAGTGLYSAEYFAATKKLGGKLKATLGLGWGRLGSYNPIGTPVGGERPPYDVDSEGGTFNADQWFRGPAALFGGLEWQAMPDLRLKAEYSSDAYTFENSDRMRFDRRSPLNFGAEYQLGEVTTLGAYYMYGSEFGLMLSFSANAANPPRGLRPRAPNPVLVRPDKRITPEAWGEGWVENPTAPQVLRDALEPRLLDEGLRLEALEFSANEAELWFTNLRYASETIALGRAARVLAEILPPSVEVFRLTPYNGGLAASTLVLRRSDLERLEFATDAAGELQKRATLVDANTPGSATFQAEEIYPEPYWSLVPYIKASFFDPDSPLRADVGLRLNGGVRFTPGASLRGSITKRIAGNIADADFVSDSALPPVRTEAPLFAREGDPALERLVLAQQTQIAPAVFTRVSAGYFEEMFGGVAGEALYSPANSRAAFGFELAYARKRDFNQRLGFQDYDVITGHASVYYDIGRGYYGQVDAGRYLAGDVGATFSLDRVFPNGATVGAFATLTDVSAEEFGEGSFDKGIRFSIPLSWFLGRPTTDSLGTTVRPILRDGGARLKMPVRLFEQVRDHRRGAIDRQWGRIWQ